MSGITQPIQQTLGAVLGNETLTPLPTPTSTPTPTPVPAVRVEQADLVMLQGDYALARQQFESAFIEATDNETRAAALVGMGHADFLLRNYPSALQALLSVTEVYPDTSSVALAHYFLGKVYSATGDYTASADSYARFLLVRTGVLDGFVNEIRGDALIAAGDAQSAISAYEAALLSAQAADITGLKIKIGKAYVQLGDNENAVRRFMDVYQTTGNEYTKAEMNLLTGQVYIQMGLPEQAYARFLDSVNNYPLAYDTYSGLVALVDAGIEVDELNRGIVDYSVGQYGLAIEAFDRYLAANPEHNGTVHHYKALCLREIGQYEAAKNEWISLINDHVDDRYWVTAWEEQVITEADYLYRLSAGAQIFLDYVKMYPNTPDAPGFLFRAARLLEKDNRLAEAATNWGRMIDEYPSDEQSNRALFLSGIMDYRLGNIDAALTVFQRSLVLAITPEEQAGAYLWIGKMQMAKADRENATLSWEQAAQRDPGSYYSERARELLDGRPPLSAGESFDLGYDLELEWPEAEQWMRTTFGIAPETDLSGIGPLVGNTRLQLADAYWEIGEFGRASAEMEVLRQEVEQDAGLSFYLLNHLVEKGYYRSAVYTSRQILSLANLDDFSTFTAPVYFNHIRFGAYYRDIVLEQSRVNNFHPLMIFSVIRQESMFEGSSGSSAGAMGLMQVMPSTGLELASELGMAANYTNDDLYRPSVNAAIGMRYLARQRDYFGGDLYAALAAYNSGPGNALAWKNISADDSDLFLETIRFSETRQYLMQIVEFMHIYKRLYIRNQ